MTTPTQAQALKELIAHTIDCERQLDEFHGLGNDAGGGKSDVVCRAEAALTAAAAAEVDKSELEKQYDHNADLDREIERLRSELATAIERCAQVGDEFVDDTDPDSIAGRVVRDLVAAIRSLKDQS